MHAEVPLETSVNLQGSSHFPRKHGNIETSVKHHTS